MTKTFFLPRSSGWHVLHPLTKLVAVCSIVLIGFLARWHPLPIALFLFVILPLAAWGEIARPVIRVTVTIVLPFIISIALVQGLFYPGASHEVYSFGPLAFKQEGLVFAYTTASKILLLAGAGLLLLFSTHPSDLTQALVERGMPSAIAYIIVAAIQLLPQMQAKANAILDAQRSRGLETEGSFLHRMRAIIPLLAPLVFGALTDVDERAMALEARAFSSTHAKTSFKELHDTRAQAIMRWMLIACAVIVGGIEIWSA